MKKWFIALCTVISLVVFLTIPTQNAEAKNPITPKQSRVTYTLKDANGVAYKVYFAGVGEKKATATADRDDWAAVGMEADEGDQLYKGNYTLYTQKIKTSHIKKSKYYFKDYLLNATRKTVHMFPSKYKGQPDILAVAYSAGDKVEVADWFYMKNGALTKIMHGDTFMYSKRAQILSKNKFQTVLYDPVIKRWDFMTFTIDPVKEIEKRNFPQYKNPSAVIKNWKKHWQ
ncbi:hypothetical protein [Bacillus sp. FJAT-52991]|uniref:Uncharacterized protein n=1 Tax=Bacillus kandeliae TaxID=3129297 RepID=A0ABZ2N271_9BACI